MPWLFRWLVMRYGARIARSAWNRLMVRRAARGGVRVPPAPRRTL